MIGIWIVFPRFGLGNRVMDLSIFILPQGWRRGGRAFLLVAAVVVLLSPAATSEAADEVGIANFNKGKAVAMMGLADAPSRALAYRACRKLGDDWKASYRNLLEAALDSHRRKIEESIDLASEEANRFSGTLLKLRQQRNFALEYTLTDLKDERSALAGLQRAHGDARLWFDEAQAQHGRAAASMAVISNSATAIDEIRRELAYCAGKVASIAPRTFERVLSKYSTVASNLHDRMAEQDAFQRTVRVYAKALEHNRAQTWATTEMRAFADLLNERRHILGLSVLRLERRLSSASALHSKEMVELGYFAHRSPVVENATPERRAQNEKYPGTFVGENIFFYGSPQAAHAAFDAWWRSDGHRFVMFDPKSDEVGLSNQPATHWTMMTGTAPQRIAVRAVRVE